MNHEWQDSDITTLVARSIDCIGTDEFTQSLAHLCLQTNAFDSAYIAAFFHDHAPCELFSNLSNADTTTTVTPYLDYAYLLDPFYDLFKEGIDDQVVFLQECAPDDFQTTDYYRLFYEETGLVGECCVFVKFGASACLAISLGNRLAAFKNPEQIKDSLESLLPVIASLCRRHWPILDPSSLKGTGRLGHHVAASFELFGSSKLSPREADIVRLILKGHSSKSIARIFDNSPETVKVHRKRIFTKLAIASQGELFSMFLEALAKTPPNSTRDPLEFIGTAQAEHGAKA
jgi:DNA-binding CsgD family transcriptional regulator